jgi:hypothetical protein
MRRLVLCLVLGLLPVAATAHHSFNSEFDRAKPITLTRTLTEVEWTNPQDRFFMEVKNETGQTTWEIELASVNAIMRNGRTRNVLKVEDAITIDGFLARTTGLNTPPTYVRPSASLIVPNCVQRWSLVYDPPIG